MNKTLRALPIALLLMWPNTALAFQLGPAQNIAPQPTVLQAAETMLELVTQPHVDSSGAPGKAIGLVVGIATPRRRYVTGFGATTLGGTERPSSDAIFELASVTKVYTGYLLARGITNAEVQLSDSLEITFGPNAPTYFGQSIELLDLATHTSRLPNYPDNLPNPGPVNPAAGYTLAMLESFLSNHSLSGPPGIGYLYSNLGSGVLGHVLVEASGMNEFEELVDREIATPYGLHDTVVTLDREQAGRKIQGYANGVPAPPIDIGGPLQAGGSLRSSGDETLRFFAGAMGGSDPAWAEVIHPRRPSPNGTNAFTGFLLNMETPPGESTIYSKNGGAPGFSTQVMFTVNPPAVVVLLSNANGTQGLYGLARTILDEIEGLRGF